MFYGTLKVRKMKCTVCKKISLETCLKYKQKHVAYNLHRRKSGIELATHNNIEEHNKA